MPAFSAELLPGAAFAFAICAVVGAAAWQYFAEKKRRAAFAEAAALLGLDYSPYDSGAALGRFIGFPFFCQGRGHSYSNLLRGRLDAKAEVLVLDYAYVTGSGKNRHTHRQTVAVFRAEGLGLPAFELRPENILHKVGGLFGYQDIDFAEHPDFSGKYLLRGKEEPAVRGLFDAAILNHFALHPGWRVEGEGDWLAVLREGRRVAPEELRSFLDETGTTFCAFRNR